MCEIKFWENCSFLQFGVYSRLTAVIWKKTLCRNHNISVLQYPSHHLGIKLTLTQLHSLRNRVSSTRARPMMDVKLLRSPAGFGGIRAPVRQRHTQSSKSQSILKCLLPNQNAWSDLRSETRSGVQLSSSYEAGIWAEQRGVQLPEKGCILSLSVP